MQSNTQDRAISKFDVMRGGKVKETFDTYEQAWAYASKYKGAVVRYNIRKVGKQKRARKRPFPFSGKSRARLVKKLTKISLNPILTN